MEKPDVDSIDGLSPAISIDQKTTSKNPRSTVGTGTEINDYAPALCSCWNAILYQWSWSYYGFSIEQIVDKVLELPGASAVEILAPVIRKKEGTSIRPFWIRSRRTAMRPCARGWRYLRCDGSARLSKASSMILKLW